MSTTTTEMTGATYVSADDMGEGTRTERETFARGYADLLRAAYARLGWEVTVRVGAGERSAESRSMEEQMQHLEDRGFDLYCGAAGDHDETLAAMERARLIPSAE